MGTGASHLDYVREQTIPAYQIEARFRFSVDPVFGYRIDAIRQIAFNEPTTANHHKMGIGTFTPGCYVPWPDVAIYNRTVYSDGGGGYRGWANNLLTMDRCDRQRMTWRDNGLIGYLTAADDWGVAFTRHDGAGTVGDINLCNAHNDFHHRSTLPALTIPGPDGRYHHRWHHRLLAVPPEVSGDLWQRMRLIEAEKTSVILSIGRPETMETQPIALSEPARGLVWTAHPPAVVTDPALARSGDRCLRFRTGRSWPNLPQVSLRPGVSYRLRAWFAIEPWTADERAAAIAADTRRRERLADKGREVPAAIDWDSIVPRARITADEYEWTPHANRWTKRQATPWTSHTDGRWEAVELLIDGADWGQNVNIVFEIEGGTARLDDFELIEIDP